MPKSKTATAKTAEVKVAKAAPKKTTAGLSVPLYNLTGEQSGSLELPKALFGVKVNKALLAQAVRVYSNNEKAHWGNTKTRGEVEGSTKKIYKQKGTGGARHGSKRAPIFVHGGIAMGPKFRKVSLNLPRKMKTTALASALSTRAANKQIVGINGLAKASGKTKEFAAFLQKTALKSVLLITNENLPAVTRAARNIPGIDVRALKQINAYEVIKHQNLVLDKGVIDQFAKNQKGEAK